MIMNKLIPDHLIYRHLFVVERALTPALYRECGIHLILRMQLGTLIFPEKEMQRLK